MTKLGITANDLNIAQTAENECTVMIWNTGTWAGALSHPGHASILMRRDKNEGPFEYEDYPPRQIRYVSFWPASDSDKTAKTGKEGNKAMMTSKRDGNFLSHHIEDYDNELGASGRAALNNGGARRPGQVVVNIDANGNDYWGQLPQHLISLPAMAGTRLRSLGLDMNEIVDWCVAFKESDEFNYTYISTSQNCAGVAVRALCAGGADAFAALGGSPSKGTIYFTPNDAKIWVDAVAVGIQRVNNMLGDLYHLSSGHPLLKTDLPTVEQWKALSNVSFSMRGSLTRGIDDALATYHTTTWIHDFPKRLGALVKMIKNTHAHFQTDSKRQPAYVALARRIIHVVRLRAAQGNYTWDTESFYGTDHLRPGPKKKTG